MSVEVLGSLLPLDTGQEVSGCKSFLIDYPLPPDTGQEVNGWKSFLGGWFVIYDTVCDMSR